ncbi:MAG: MAPEG family protein [Gammaproteobacteria bacterium]|nr:MAPEG family protein [Gammaproteobacteria bacterium]
MTLSQTPELFWLALSLVLTGLLWAPYIMQLIIQLGPVEAIWDPTGAHPHDAQWALRARLAHYNAAENMAVFAPLVILVYVLELGDGLTATAAMTYFFARLAHYLIYIWALPVLRTIAFLIGFGCQAVFALRLFGLV